jgi:arginine-tRNA-protein transferase
VTEVGIGTYSILKQVQIAREHGQRYLYLGLYIENCGPMAYKARFLPHQRRIHARWQRFDRGPRKTPVAAARGESAGAQTQETS